MRLLPSDGKGVLIKQPHHSLSGYSLKNEMSFYFQIIQWCSGDEFTSPGSLDQKKHSIFPLAFRKNLCDNKIVCILFFRALSSLCSFEYTNEYTTYFMHWKKTSTVVLPCFWGQHLVMHKIKIHLLEMQNDRKIKSYFLKNSSKLSDLYALYGNSTQKHYIPAPQHSFSLSFCFFFLLQDCACVQEELKGFTAAVGTGWPWEMWKLKSRGDTSGQVNGDYVPPSNCK